MKTVYAGGEGEIVEKKSRFIANGASGKQPKRKQLLLLMK